MKKLVLSFIFTITVFGVIIFFLLTHGDREIRLFGFDVAKLLIQLILIVVFGGILIQEYNRKRERKEALNDFRKMILRDLIRAYADTKKARRLLRAKCGPKANAEDNNVGEVPYVVYEEQIHNINDIQLRLETLKHELDTFKEAFTDESELKSCIESMEKYLRRLVTEYEKISATDSPRECLSISQLNHLKNFIHRNPGKELSPFTNDFTSIFRRSLELIQAESLKV